jgi:hypothetical protein
MKRPRSEIASSINPDSVLIIDEATARDRADPKSEDEAALLALIDGKRSVAEVLRMSKMSGFVAMRRLRSLLERQIVRPGLRVTPITATPTAGEPGGALKAGRLGLTQDLTSAATSFAAQASQRRTSPMSAAPVGKPAPAPSPGVTAPAPRPGVTAAAPRPGVTVASTAPNAPAPGEPRTTPLQGTVSLPSVIITFGPDFLEPRSMPTRRLPGAGILPRASASSRPTMTTAPVSPPPPALEARPSESSALVPTTPSTGTSVVSLQKTSMMPRANGRRLRRRTPASSHEIEAQELWLSVTKREWATLAVIPAHPDGSALSIATALAEAGSLLRGKPVELFSADRADMSSTGQTVLNGRSTGSIQLHSVPPGGLPPASERFERVVALEPLSSNPIGATIAHAAEAVLMVAEQGVTELRAAKRTMEMIGRDRFIGCILVNRR